jgi:hypothetical protein
MKILALSVIALLLLGCPTAGSPEQISRDAIAASNGVISSAQAQNHDACVAAPSGSNCILINKAIDGQHFVKSSLDVYCQFSPSDAPDKVCVPLKAALPALQSAVSNLNALTNSVKGIIK